MIRLTHSDNICTVGWTCFTAVMTVAEMRWLLEKQPKGDFTPCFYPPWSDFVKLTPDLVQKYLDEGNGRVWEPACYYFTFPRDALGEALLDELFGEDKKPCRWVAQGYLK